jgi:hypothetical protein
MQTATVVFDGRVLRPDLPLNLTPHGRYLITIQAEEPAPPEGDAWDILEALAGSVDAPPDWAGEHDHYLYGTPKRQDKTLHER